MEKKMGRPKSNNPLNIDIKVRINQSTNEKILKICEKKHITRAEFIRNVIEEYLNIN